MYIWKILGLDFYLVLISFMSKVYISHFFPPKMGSICFIFLLNEHTIFYVHNSVSRGS